MKSRAAALFELAAAAARARLVAADGRRCDRRRRGRSEVLSSALVPPFLAFEFSSLLFGLPAFGGFLLFEHFGVPDGFPLGELLRGEGFRWRLAPVNGVRVHGLTFALLA